MLRLSFPLVLRRPHSLLLGPALAHTATRAKRPDQPTPPLFIQMMSELMSHRGFLLAREFSDAPRGTRASRPGSTPLLAPSIAALPTAMRRGLLGRKEGYEQGLETRILSGRICSPCDCRPPLYPHARARGCVYVLGGSGERERGREIRMGVGEMDGAKEREKPLP